MKDLQEKYKSYKTPFDESAFEHFKTIQQKGKVGQKINSWHIAVVVLLLSIPAIFFIHALMSSKDVIVQDVPTDIRQEEKQDATLEIPNVSETVEYDNKTDIKAVEPAVTKTILNDEITNKTEHLIESQKEIHNITPTKEQDVISDIRNDMISTNQHVIIQNNNAPSEKTDVTPYQTPIIEEQKTIEITKPKDNIQTPQTRQSYQSKPVALKTPLLTHDDAQNFELSPMLSPVTPADSLKAWGYYRNHLKLSHSYMLFYRGNTPLGIIPGYTPPSYFTQGEYFRELNKIISLGSSIGFARGVDPDTQVKDSLSYHNVKFAHLNLYFFLVNSKRHQLYFKIGSGITHTKMQVLTATLTPPDIITPVLRRGNYTNPGLLLELSYSYHFRERWFASVNTGRLWYTFGSEYLGVSLGYTF